MTLLFFDGFQDAATVQKPEWDIIQLWTTLTGRDGSTNGGAAHNGNNTARTLTLPSAATTCIVGMGVMCSIISVLGNTTMINLGFVRSGTVEMVLTINTSGLIEVRRTSATGTLLGTSSGHIPFTVNVWRHLQVKTLLHTSAGTCEIMLDGVVVLSLTGLANSGTTGDVTALRWNAPSGSAAGMVYDDLWVCDAVDATATQGRANNTYLGDLKVTTLIPSANGTNTAWSKSTGTNAAALVDEVPPNTTDYIFSSTVTQKESMALPDLPATTGNVFGARVILYASKSDAGARSVKPAVRESGGTFTAQTAKALSTTFAAYSGEFLFTKPSASTTPWSASDINGLEAGVELV